MGRQNYGFDGRYRENDNNEYQDWTNKHFSLYAVAATAGTVRSAISVFGWATATPKAAVQIRTIQTARFFMTMLLMCSPFSIGHGRHRIRRESHQMSLSILHKYIFCHPYPAIQKFPGQIQPPLKIFIPSRPKAVLCGLGKGDGRRHASQQVCGR